MERNEIIPLMRKYNKTVSTFSLTSLEKQYVKNVEERDYFFGFPIKDIALPKTAEEFLKQQNYFHGLLKGNGDGLCFYLRHIQNYTCNSGLIRMDARSRDFSRYSAKVLRAIGAFYLFQGLGLSIKDVIYGQCREFQGGMDFSSVIATELLQGNEEVIQYCRDVLLSENNTAVLTRDVIEAIEQSKNAELQNLLAQLLLAAKLQEGLRQSILETVDENDRDYFLSMTEVVEKENLLRFSSVQRAVMTWIGLGYAEVTEKDVRYLFGRLRLYLTDENARRELIERSCMQATKMTGEEENPLELYLALYCLGTKDVEEAIAEAFRLLESPRRHVVAGALVYLKMTNSFDVEKYLYFPEKFAGDEWILALFYSECARNIQRLSGISREEARKLYDAMEAFLKVVGAKKTWSSKGFAWFTVTLSKDAMCYAMVEIVDHNPEKELIERFLPYVPTLYYQKLDRFMEKRFGRAGEEARKKFLLKEILSSNEGLVKWVEKEYLNEKMTEEDLIALEGRLKSKKAKARAAIVRVLAAQSEENVRESYGRLKGSSVKTIRESAMELRNLKPEYFKDYEENVENVQGVCAGGTGPTGNRAEKAEPPSSNRENAFHSDIYMENGRIFLENMGIGRQTPIRGREEGFGLYTPGQIHSIEYENRLKVVKKGLFRKTEVLDVGFLLPWRKQQILDYLRLWNERIMSHENDEYYNGYAYRQVKEKGFWPSDRSKKSLDAMPLSEVWRAYFEEDHLSAGVVFELYFLLSTIHDSIFWEKNLRIESELFTLEPGDVKQYQYLSHFENIMDYYMLEWKEQGNFAEKAAAFLQMILVYCKGKTQKRKNYRGDVEVFAVASCRSVYNMRRMLGLEVADDETFRKYFPLELHLYQSFNVGLPRDIKEKPTIMPIVFARAVQLHMAPKEMLYEVILDKHMESPGPRSYYRQDGQLFEAYRDAYFEGRGVWGKPHLSMKEYQHSGYKFDREVYEVLREALDDIAEALLAMETQRLNEKTIVTDYVGQMVVIRGISHLAQALSVLEGETLCRSTYGDDRNAVFSNVIRHVYPGGLDDPAVLLSAGFSEDRLVETAMLAPQWIDKINEVLGWEGFKEACYYFIAHMKQYDYEQKKAEIARYTQLEPEELNDGAFDIKWCQTVYETLGEKRFQVVYKASKFLCENAFHTRSRKYADACLGKIPKEEWKKQVVEKRNKDALNAYCICPIEDDKDLLERYLFVQNFAKESKKFGSQRQASEKRASEMALLNLARNSRFETVTRLSWLMESEMIAQSAWALRPVEVQEGIEIWIEIDEQGAGEIAVRKNGKKQKTVPAAVKKNEKYLEIKAIQSGFKEQYRRSRSMLEQAMEERTEFSREEILAIMKNPVVAPMVEKLVLLSGGQAGFYTDGKLAVFPQDMAELADTIRIAHPYDLYEMGCWHMFQSYVFGQGMIQPFKQVFRELYLAMEEEKDRSESRRYSGYQIQTKKAASVLKGRKWNVSYENGLERVYYKENLVVNLFAEADWFSPGDIEAPSIEYVAFYSRKGGGQVRIRDIDPVVFSEVMRDIDLAVSTAYVGGVDPVTSFSTMELRKTIAAYTCRLMKLENVSVREHFADIKGMLNDYSVHLGSGIIHQAGGAAIHVLAVHSQKRGKVYLPFLDEDPKTAEIISKIVLLAEDGKIKDPEILRQIQTRK
ncbi:DUF5724 domain-containing protein [Roseburia hominis]